MGFYQDCILPWGINWVMSGREFQNLRLKTLQGLSGVGFEIGFGTGLNLPFYPEEVQKLYAMDPSPLGQKIARKRIDQASFPLEFLNFDENTIALQDNSVDFVLSTWTLCSIEKLQYALLELKRILKPGGVFYFLEHGQSNETKVSKWQDRLNPLQKKFAGGCQLTVKIAEEIKQAGFQIKELENFYMKGPKIQSYIYRGIAIKSLG